LEFSDHLTMLSSVITARLRAALIMIMIMINSVLGMKGHLHGWMRGGSYF